MHGGGGDGDGDDDDHKMVRTTRTTLRRFPVPRARVGQTFEDLVSMADAPPCAAKLQLVGSWRKCRTYLRKS